MQLVLINLIPSIIGLIVVYTCTILILSIVIGVIEYHASTKLILIYYRNVGNRLVH